MASISLKKLVRKSKGSLLWTYLQNENGQNISIIDTNEQLIIGNEIDSQAKKFPIEVDGNILGHVCGDNHAQLLAYFLRDQAEKEDEKKKIANEVLGLYREINLIYNFSDKLALSIDPEAIGSMVLEEASNLIQATAGAVILLDEQNQKPDILASFGNSFIHFDSSSEEGSFWNQVSMGKQSEIRHNLPMEIHVKSLIHAPLKVKHRLMGSIILAHEDAVEHSAADLKLLTTLALQTSSAIESALLYEKRIREAEDRERAMREIHDITVKFV
ncbi:MAG: GAF domain-containing protein, partial [Bacteroidia bacterium]|nr:GAF domain-containing protein [Bacteroidia bacterium]